MKRALYALIVLLLAALYVYFLGTPFVAGLTGLSPRAVSLSAGLVILASGIVAIALGRRMSQGAPRNRE